MKKDYYEILGLQRDASVSDIKKKYRSLALRYHPDRVEADKKKEAEERFKEISEAYGVLSDPKKKQLYDQYGHSGIDQNFTAEDIFRGADFSSIFGDSGLGDIFGSIFGGGFEGFGGGHSRGPQRGRDIQYEIDITLQEAYKGVTRKIKVPRYEYCRDCQGTGAKNGTSLKTCATCQGQGAVMMQSGFFRMQQTCSACGGAGKTILEQCPTCHGQGRNRVTRTIDVTIPPGVDSNSRLRVRHEGEVGAGGPGDLYLYIHVLDDSQFQRDGDDIYINLPVSYPLAALGGDVKVPTLNGSVTMKVPGGTQSGKVFRLKGKGMPNVHHRAQYGDQYVKIMVAVPKKLSGKQKELIEELARVSGDDVSVGKNNDTIAEKIKKVFK